MTGPTERQWACHFCSEVALSPLACENLGKQRFSLKTLQKLLPGAMRRAVPCAELTLTARRLYRPQQVGRRRTAGGCFAVQSRRMASCSPLDGARYAAAALRKSPGTPLATMSGCRAQALQLHASPLVCALLSRMAMERVLLLPVHAPRSLTCAARRTGRFQSTLESLPFASLVLWRFRRGFEFALRLSVR